MFDSESAWNKTIRDKEYSYDIPFSKFMKIYQKYRSDTKEITTPLPTIVLESKPILVPVDTYTKSTTPVKTVDKQKENKILDQDEVDDLLKLFQDRQAKFDQYF